MPDEFDYFLAGSLILRDCKDILKDEPNEEN